MSPQIAFVSETGSTNADLIARIASGDLVPDQSWLVADRQTSGRGRRGRQWLDGAGNFMGSVAVRLHEQGPPPATLSFVAALALYEAINPHLLQPQELTLKWPNDLLLDGAKLCGILLEREGDFAVIGIGANLVGAPDLPDRRTTSLSAKGPPPSRDQFAQELATSMATEVQRWREFGFGPIRNRWEAVAHPKGTPLNVAVAENEAIAGQYDGLSPEGALCLRLPDGSSRVIHAGDVELEAR